MALCAQCKTQDTDLYMHGVPICMACANKRDLKIQQAVYEEAVRRANRDGARVPKFPKPEQRTPET